MTATPTPKPGLGSVYHDHGPDKPICPTIRALDATPKGGES